MLMAFAVNMVTPFLPCTLFPTSCTLSVFLQSPHLSSWFYFCAPQTNINEIVLASSHDVQELDVSALLAAQPYIWIGEDCDRESKRFGSPNLPLWLSGGWRAYLGNVLHARCPRFSHQDWLWPKGASLALSGFIIAVLIHTPFAVGRL